MDLQERLYHKDTQDELDAMYLGPPMPIEQKYAYLLTLIFVDLTYSATLPLMNFITLINLRSSTCPTSTRCYISTKSLLLSTRHCHSWW